MERRLGAQERDVLRLYGSGLSVEEVADRLQISETTVAWIVGNLVTEWGTHRADELARALAISRRDRFFAQFALPLGVMLVLTIATFVALGATGTLHGPFASPSAPQTASPTTLGSSSPMTATGTPSPPPTPGATDRPAAADASAPLPTVAPPMLVPILPTIPPILPPPPSPSLPAVAPSLPPPLPPLPTVPPLPTPPRL